MQKTYESSYNHHDVRILEKNTIPGTFFSLTQYRAQYCRYDGNFSGIIEREIFIPLRPAAGMLLYDPRHQKIALTEQCRLGALADPITPWIIEIVMGMIDPGEHPHEAAVREAREEAGVEVGRVIALYEYFPSPGISAEHIHLYCGEMDSEQVGGVHGLDSEDENIKVITMTLGEAEDALKTGLIKASSTIIAIQWLLLNRTTLWV